jgi:hypothetical protein
MAKKLKKYVTDIETAMALDDDTTKWFATELNSDDFPVLGDNVADDIKTSKAKRRDEKATIMFSALYNRVKLDSRALTEFVTVLKKDETKFKTLIEKLEGNYVSVLDYVHVSSNLIKHYTRLAC